MDYLSAAFWFLAGAVVTGFIFTIILSSRREARFQKSINDWFTRYNEERQQAGLTHYGADRTGKDNFGWVRGRGFFN